MLVTSGAGTVGPGSSVSGGGGRESISGGPRGWPGGAGAASGRPPTAHGRPGAGSRRLDEHPGTMRQRRETGVHPFCTIKAWMGATHFLMKTLPQVATEMALHVLAYNLKRVINIMAVRPLLAVMRA